MCAVIMSKVAPGQGVREGSIPFHVLCSIRTPGRHQPARCPPSCREGPEGTAGSSDRRVWTFQDGTISALSRPCQDPHRTPSLGWAPGPLSCILLTTHHFSVPVLSWSPGPNTLQVPIPPQLFPFLSYPFPQPVPVP